jgi:anti-sigma factor RsiW
MTRTDCEEFLADREANPSHLESCESCREDVRRLEALERGLASARFDSRTGVASPDSLPLAPWEGAGTRSWLAVLVVAGIVVVLGLGGFMLLGIHPIEGFVAALSGAASTRHLLTVAKSAPNFLAAAPIHVHVLILGAFVLVNVLFVVLLRRRLRGYDA